MAPSNEFEDLKKKWLQEKGTGGGKNNERQLGGKIIAWVQGILAGMSNDDDAVDQSWCESAQPGEKSLASEEMEVCKFILQNLYKIKKIRGNECNKENIDKQMEEYVYCTTLNLWSTLYLINHCDKNNVVNKAYDAMKILGVLGGEVQCDVCEYKDLEHMKILGKFDMLGVTLGLMNTNPKVMKLIVENKKPEQQCKEQKDASSKLVEGLLKNSVTMSTGIPSPTTTAGNDANAAGSARSAANSKASKSIKTEGGVKITLKRDGGVTIESDPDDEQNTEGDPVILFFGENAVLLGTEHMSNGVTKASTATVPTTAEKGRKAQQSPSLPRNVSLGPIGDSFTDFLVKWIERRDIGDDDGFVILMQLDRNYSCVEKIWDDLKNEWDELIKKLAKPEEEAIKGICENNSETNERIPDEKRPLCKTLLKIFLYMDGTKEPDSEVEKEEKAFMRCIVGAASMINLYGDYCNFGEMRAYAYKAASGLRSMSGKEDNSKKCDWMDFKKLKIGSQLIGERIAKWNEEGRDKVEDHENIKEQCCSCPTYKEGAIQGAQKKKEAVGEPKWAENQNVQNVKNIFEEKKYLTKDRAEEVMKKMKKYDLNDINKIEEIIQQEIQKQRTPIEPSELGANCDKNLDEQLEEGEGDSIEEWFTRFSNNPSSADKDVDFTQWKALSSMCYSHAITGRNMSGVEKEFCKIMIRNVLMVNKGEFKCEKEKIQRGKGRKCISKCDLLNMWLMYVNSQCIERHDVQYAFEAVKSWNDAFDDGDGGRKCGYGRISNHYRNNKDVVNLILNNMMCKAKKGELNEIHRKNWCNSGKVKYTKGVSTGVARAGSSRSKIAKVNQIMEGLDELTEEYKEQLGKVKEEIEKVQAPSLPQPPPAPPAGGARGEPTNETVEAGNKSAASSHSNSKSVECNGSEGIYGTIEDAEACFSDLDDLPTAEPSAPLPNENQEATGKSGPVGAAGSNIATIELTKDITKPSSDPIVPPTHTNLQPPSTGNTSTQSPGSSEPGSTDATGNENTQVADTAKAGTEEQSGKSGQDGAGIGTGASGEKGANGVLDPKSNDNAVQVDPQKPQTGGHSPPEGGAQGPKGNPASSTTGHTQEVQGVSDTITKLNNRGPAPKLLNPPKAMPTASIKEVNFVDPLLPYLPTIPAIIGITTMTYYLWKYFFLGKRRKRHRRAHQVSAPPSLGEQFLAHVEDQADGPHEYTLVKKRRKPRSAPVRRRKRERAARRVGHRTIIDIHLEVLDECQKGDLHSTKEDFFEILVREFMESEFMKEEIIPMKHVPSLDSGFREEDFVSKDDVSKIEVPSSDSGV